MVTDMVHLYFTETFFYIFQRFSDCAISVCLCNQNQYGNFPTSCYSISQSNIPYCSASTLHHNYLSEAGIQGCLLLICLLYYGRERRNYTLPAEEFQSKGIYFDDFLDTKVNGFYIDSSFETTPKVIISPISHVFFSTISTFPIRIYPSPL